MRRLIFALFLMVTLFALMTFVVSNSGAETFGLPVALKFIVPPFIDWSASPIPLGYIIMGAFCLGMVVTPFFEALPSFYKSLELRAKNKRIRQLERELGLVRGMLESDKTNTVPPAAPAAAAASSTAATATRSAAPAEDSATTTTPKPENSNSPLVP